MESQSLQTIIFSKDYFEVLDQTLLPSQMTYLKITDIPLAISSIKEMRVRGAPLIAVVALNSLAYSLQSVFSSIKTPLEAKEFLLKGVEALKASRPTAVNLANDLKSLLKGVDELKEPNLDSILSFVKAFAKTNYSDYEQACSLISNKGADIILDKMKERNLSKINILTICNTGKLATPGDGTALGIIREIHRRNQLKQLYIPETRPYNQGSRLTASEALADKIPSTLITDSMAGFLMHENKIDCVIVGADRVVQNGTTANKIGTYSLAVLANYHKIPFYVACPYSTIDPDRKVGSEIIIEERPEDELRKLNGIPLAPKDFPCWNPAFDLTYPNLIEKIITEKGEFKFDHLMGDWELLSGDSLISVLKHKLKLFPKDDPLTITDVADGNLNLVYKVKGLNKTFCVKQALPYVKCVGPQWELTLKRALFESQCLQYEGLHCPSNVPAFIAFDQKLALLVMEFLEEPYIILRKGLLKQKKYLNIGKTIGEFVAKTCFFSSGIHLKADILRENIAFWCQNSLCALTEQVIFSDPYIKSPLNHYNSLISSNVEQLQRNNYLLHEIMKLRSRFIGVKQALLHGDLHTGSIMVDSNGGIKVIDSEFAFYGPIGFDLGAFLSNLLLNYFSQRGYIDNKDYEEWILNEMREFIGGFIKEFGELWQVKGNSIGDDYPERLMGEDSCLFKEVLKGYLKEIWEDCLGFTGAKMIRRIIGIAHVIDLDGIEDLEKRAVCEKKALEMAEYLICNRKVIEGIEEVINLARKINEKIN